MPKRARRADVLAEEQRAVDHAYHCLEGARRTAEALKGVGAAASGKDAIDANRAWQRELERLDLGRNALVFMRVDVDEGNGRERFYIGRRSVFDADHNTAVVSWSAPTAVRWRLSSEQEPGDVRLLRQIVCDERLVKRYFDLHGSTAVVRQQAMPSQRQEDTVEPPQAAEARNDSGDEADGDQEAASSEQEWRDPLLDELDRARDGAMHDIVETIQRDQLRLVTGQPDGVLIVQGGPGTGKTAVGLHRVSWLLDNSHVAADDLLVVGPSRGFLDYARTALVELGNGGVTMLELPALWSGATARRDPRQVALVKSDARMSLVLQRAVDNQTIAAVERLEALVGGPVFTFELRRREVVVPVTELARIAEDALAGDSPYRVRRERCAQRIVQHLTEAYLRLLPGPADTDYFAEIRRSRPVTRLLRRMAPELTSRDVLRRILSSGAAMDAAADGVLTPAERSLVIAHTEAAGRDASLREPSLEDLVCLDELEHVLSGRPDRTYGHLVVDEAQDITPMQARSLARRCPSGSMTILGDLAQATGPFPYEDWEPLGIALVGRGGRRLAELLTGFRVPGEVMDFVRPLGSRCAPGIAVPTSVRRTGSAVRVVEGADPASRAAQYARDLAGGPDGTEAGRVTAVIVPEAAHFQETVAAAVADHESISVLTADEVKGLEFDHVVVVEPSVIAGDDPVGLRRLYVALTRCTQSLTVVHHRPLPRWIGGPENPAPTPKQVMDRAGRRKAEHAGVCACTRYRSDGTRCANETRQPDGWCRAAECAGFRTATPTPAGKRGYLGVPDGAVTDARLELSPEHVGGIRITSAACGAFIGLHRGSPAEAAVELHTMLIPFLAEGRHLRSPDGWCLDLDGYRLVLDAEARAVTGYASGHAERSHAQFRAGIPSRVGWEARAGRRSALTPPEAAEGDALADETAMRNLPTRGLHVTVTACAGYERLSPGRDLSDEDFLRRLREDLDADLSTGRMEWVGRRVFVDGERCQWSLRSDGQVLTKVRQAGAEIYRGPAGQRSDNHQREGNGMSATTVADGTTTPGTDAESSPGLGRAVAERQRAARRDRVHESLRHRLLADLYERFTDAGDSDHVDAWSLGPEGLTLFEVVGEHSHDYARVREAALHLLEAAYLHPGGQAEYLVIVLREPPTEPWAAEIADGAFSVSLAWRDGAGWAGPGAQHIVAARSDEEGDR